MVLWALCALQPLQAQQSDPPTDEATAYRQNADQLADKYLRTDYLRSMCDSARRANKTLLFYFHASWCPACRNMEEFVFPDIDVATLLKSRFLFVPLDGRLDFDGIEMAQKFNVEVYPTLLAIGADGQLLRSLIGYHGEVQLLEKLGDIRPTRK